VKLEIIFDYPFTKKNLKDLNIKSITELNGFYLYNTKNKNTAYINLSSRELKYIKAESLFIKWFSTNVQHETIHHSICMITKKDANHTEERFVDIMTGEIPW